MRTALSLAALLCATAAAADAPRTADAPDARLNQPSEGRQVCRDRIEAVRAASGQQRLDRDNATSDQALLIAAVDKRIGGCAVMVMYNNTRDIRPLPAVPEGPARVRRVR